MSRSCSVCWARFSSDLLYSRFAPESSADQQLGGPHLRPMRCSLGPERSPLDVDVRKSVPSGDVSSSRCRTCNGTPNEAVVAAGAWLVSGCGHGSRGAPSRPATVLDPVNRVPLPDHVAVGPQSPERHQNAHLSGVDDDFTRGPSAGAASTP